MSIEQLRQEIMDLPLAQRVEVAQLLWQSIHEGSLSDLGDEGRSAAREARQRDGELDSGAAQGRSHEQVMEAARQALQCG